MQKPRLVKSKASPSPEAQKQSMARAAILLRIEAEARSQTTEAELRYHLANQTRPILEFRHAFILRVKGKRAVLEAVSSLAAIERDAPMTRWIERLTKKLIAAKDTSEQIYFEADEFSDDLDPEAKNYPFKHMLWTPLKTAKGKVYAGLITSRESEWADDDRTIALRVSQTYSHAWRALVGEKRAVKKGWRPGRVILPLLAAGIVAAGFIPVPLTAIAPMEVVPQSSILMAAGINGVIEEIVVDPNVPVKEGDLLFRYQEDEVVNTFHVAERQVAVAEARALRARQAAVASAEAKAEVAIAMAELEVARAERDFARAQTEKLRVTAPNDGIAVFVDKRDWKGRPVQVGERVMEIAEPGAVEFEIELAVDDAIVLNEGARVRIFLDTAPLDPVEAVLVRGAYQAQPIEEGRLAYKLVADPDAAEAEELPRIGTRGSAQVYGDEVPLALFLFRRPISSLRQNFGL